MKIVKKICKGFLILCLINLICLLILSFSVKGMFSEILAGSAIKQTIKEQVVNSEVVDDAEFNEKMDKLLENKELTGLIDKYLDSTLEGLASDSEIDDINIEEDILNFIKENKEVLEKEFNVEISDEDIDKIVEESEYQDLSEQYKEAIVENRKALSEPQKLVLKGFNFFLSGKFKMIVLAISCLVLVLIALLQKSWHRWIKTLGSTLITCGAMVLVMAIAVKAIINKALVSMESNIVINISSLVKASIVTLVIGLVLFIGYIIILKIVKKKEVKDEVSTVS